MNKQSKSNKANIILSLIFMSLVILAGILTFNAVSLEKSRKNEKAESLVNAYIGFINATSIKDVKEEDFENLKYRYFSESPINIASKTVYRAHDVAIESSANSLGGGILKKTQFMEVFRKDDELGESRINFARKKETIILSSTFGNEDCALFSKEIIENNLKLTINDKNVENLNSIREFCVNKYNVVIVKNQVS